jgi:hypothetical protein
MNKATDLIWEEEHILAERARSHDFDYNLHGSGAWAFAGQASRAGPSVYCVRCGISLSLRWHYSCKEWKMREALK